MESNEETLRYHGHSDFERVQNLINDLDTWINNLDNLPEFANGQVIWIPLTDNQKQLIRAQKHTLEGVKEMVKERFGVDSNV